MKEFLLLSTLFFTDGSINIVSQQVSSPEYCLVIHGELNKLRDTYDVIERVESKCIDLSEGKDV